MLKIKDVIDVPPVKTVIELADVRDSDEKNLDVLYELLETFVVTEDIEQNMRIILDRIANYPQEGMGFFLTGNFGSGKSHFLSVLSILLQYPWSWKYITTQSTALERYEGKLKDRKFLILQIPLLEYRKTDTLEDIFWDNVENELASPKHKIFIPLAQASYFLEQFERYVLPAHKDDIDSFIKDKLNSKYSWEIIRRQSANDAISLAQEFLKVQKEQIPFKLTLDRQATWDKLIAIIKKYNFAGVVVLMDELSEFLKSKTDARLLNEDTRFLQFLGEKSSHNALWIVGALQESIEKTGDISQTTFNKIKDRYQRNLELSAKHIRELLDKRLIQKKGPSAISAIKSAYHTLKNSFNDLRISEEEFLQIYPVHPETLELLDINTGFFSQRRGVVDFIHYQIKGDPSRQIKGIMDEDYTQLLTPDKIFDHFAFRIREMVNLNAYYQIYKDYFEKRIPRIFDNEIDQEYALRLIKILILLKISPVIETRNVRQLANMLLYNYTDLGGDLNYEYIHQQILRKLQLSASYIKVKQGQEPLSDVYYIDLESKTSDIIEHRKRDILLSISNTDHRILDVAFDQLIYGPLPLAHLRGIYSERKNIMWENTPRSGSVKLQNLTEITTNEIEQAIEKLRTTEDDFVIYIGTPFNVNEQQEHIKQVLNSTRSRFSNGIIYWLPKELDDTEKLQVLRDFYAQHEVFYGYSSDGSKMAIDIREILKKSMEEKVVQVREVIEELYFSGTVNTIQGEIPDFDLSDSRLQNFNNTIGKIIREPLRTLYPSHIAPEIEISTRRLISDLIDDFIRPGKVDDISAPHLRYLRTSIEGIALPLGIAKKRNGGYELNFDINKIPLLSKIINILPQKNSDKTESSVDYEWVYKQLRKSEYGLIAPIYELLITALMRKGQIIGYKSGVQVSISQIGFPISNYIQKLEHGQLIDGELRWQLAEVSSAMLGEKLQDFDVEKQEDIWAKLCELKENVTRQILSSRQDLQLLIDKLPPSCVNSASIMENLIKTQALLAEIRPSLSSKEGIEHFLKTIQSRKASEDDIRKLMGMVETVRTFVNEEMQSLLNIVNYINSPSLIIPEDEKYAKLRSLREKVRDMIRIDDEFIFRGGMDKLRDAFKQFKDSYIAIYSEEHKAGSDSFDSESLIDLKNTDEYQILSQFAKISLISVPNDLVRINKIIDNENRRVCQRLVHEELEHFPICSCGFRLGTKPGSVNTAEVKKMIESGIRQFIRSIQEEPYGEQIQDYISKMRQLGQSIPYKELNNLMNLDPDIDMEDLKDEISRILTPISIQHINRALGGNVIIVKRNISQLYNDLVDKKYPKAKVKEIIERWIEGEEKLPDDVYIMIEEGRM